MSVSSVRGSQVAGLTPQEKIEMGGKIADRLESTEANLVKAMKGNDKSAVFEAQAAYDFAKEMYSLFLNLLKSGHDSVMEAIRNISR